MSNNNDLSHNARELAAALRALAEAHHRQGVPLASYWFRLLQAIDEVTPHREPQPAPVLEVRRALGDGELAVVAVAINDERNRLDTGAEWFVRVRVPGPGTYTVTARSAEYHTADITDAEAWNVDRRTLRALLDEDDDDTAARDLEGVPRPIATVERLSDAPTKPEGRRRTDKPRG
jgi:hypothetical protein